MIHTIELFPELSNELISVLKGIPPDDWDKPSPIEGRTVKDLVSHLIDGSLRRLSLQRDQYSSNKRQVKSESYNDLVAYIQRLNKDWMDGTERLSPTILIDLLEYSENELYHFLKTLDPYGRAFFSVAWAGESESENWFDIAREYTEKWHHQMQIRMSVNIPLLMEQRYIEPLYDTFMLGLPHLYSDMTGYPVGEVIEITITGKLNKTWYLRRGTTHWELDWDTELATKNVIEFSEELAWLVFTNTHRNKEAYRSKIRVSGDEKLGFRLLDFVTVMS